MMKLSDQATLLKWVVMLARPASLVLVALVFCMAVISFPVFDVNTLITDDDNQFDNDISDVKQSSKWFQLSESLRSLRLCVLRREYNETHLYWNVVSSRINRCVALLSNIRMRTYQRFHMGRFGEQKVFVPLSESTHSCNWLTIGIGGDTQVEKEFKAMYPDCRLFGIEPMADQALDFHKYGTVITEAAGTEPSTETLTVRTNKIEIKHTGDSKNTTVLMPLPRYMTRSIKVKPLQLLLDEYIGTRFINYATVDIEGFEYKLLKSFFRGELFDKEGIVLCQLDVEWHHRDTSKGVTQVDGNLFIQQFIAESPYVPIFGDNFGNHRKMTFIHSSDEACLRSVEALNLFDMNLDHKE